jgi:glycine/D-amino acid oxidase-like deaminating enzyme
VIRWRAGPGGGVRVTTGRAGYTADQLVICPGPWAPELLDGLGVPFGIERQVQYWFAPAAGIAPFRAEPKFVPVVGEIVADLVAGGATAHPIGLFDPGRLAPSPPKRASGERELSPPHRSVTLSN